MFSFSRHRFFYLFVFLSFTLTMTQLASITLLNADVSRLPFTLTNGYSVVTAADAITVLPLEESNLNHSIFGFHYPSFGSIENLNFAGDASQFEDRLRLTPAAGYHAGAIWYNVKQPVADGFQTIFQFQITEKGATGSWPPGADGLVFLIQNDNAFALGGVGEGIGYTGITNSLAVEFDTWDNTWWNEPNDNHISVQTGGTGPNNAHPSYSLGYTIDIPDMSDGSIHAVKIDYIPGTLRVFLNNLVNPVLVIEVDLSDLLELDNDTAWVGFTSATGAAWENHDLISWSFGPYDGISPDPFIISGRVIDTNNDPITGVIVATNTGHNTTTDTNGNYTFTGLITGTYTLSPSKAGYTFSPTSRTVSVPPSASGQNFTGIPTAGAQPPIVLLPGIMGSRLTNTPTTTPQCLLRPSDEVWPGLLHLVDPIPPQDPLYYNNRVKSLQLKLNENGTGVVPANNCDIITATGVFTELPLPGIYQDYYQQFLDDLASEGYEVYAFAYDWRLDLEEIAQVLDNYLITTVGASEVILVGHSLGGLVARQYTANATRAQRVEKVISVGTPYWGAPLAAMHMRRGTIPVDQLNYLLKNADVRDFHRNSPAVMQILPSPAFLQQAPPYFIYNHTWFHSYTATTNFFKNNGQTGTLLDQARDRHNAIDNFNNALHVPYYILTANHSNAVTLVREYDCWFGLGRCWEPLAYARGDGTVPWVSARLSGLAGDWSGAAEVCTFTAGVVTKEHSQLLADSNVIADVKRIIQGQAPQHCAGASALAALPSEPDPFIQVALWGAARVTVTDSQGRSAYLNEDRLLINEIPLVSYQAAEDSVFITLPASDTYTLTLAQESDLPLQLRISEFQAESVEDLYQVQARALFIDAPSAEGGLATLSLDLADDLSALQLLVDLNNDGNPDHVLPPSAVLDAEESQDITMPVTTIVTQGTPGDLGFYTGVVTVTLTASDVGAGVFKTEYSLDGGGTWQLYTEPISFTAEDVPIFYARSVDRAGNAEFPWPKERLQSHSLFLPTIQR
jgi:pimeloyl-ACP methyl ester carboxylesterase